MQLIVTVYTNYFHTFRSREQYADTSTTSSQNLSSSEYMDVSTDASSTLTDTTISSTHSNGKKLFNASMSSMSFAVSIYCAKIVHAITDHTCRKVLLLSDFYTVKKIVIGTVFCGLISSEFVNRFTRRTIEKT